MLLEILPGFQFSTFSFMPCQRHLDLLCSILHGCVNFCPLVICRSILFLAVFEPQVPSFQPVLHGVTNFSIKLCWLIKPTLLLVVSASRLTRFAVSPTRLQGQERVASCCRYCYSLINV